MVLKVETVMIQRSTNVVKQQKHPMQTGATNLQVIFVPRVCQKQELGLLFDPLLGAVRHTVIVIQIVQAVE